MANSAIPEVDREREKPRGYEVDHAGAADALAAAIKAVGEPEEEDATVMEEKAS